MTGTESSAPDGAAKPAGLASDKPICVYITDGIDGDEQKKLETIVFKAEKVALGMKAFRTVRMDSTQAAADPLLADAGTETPRLVLINPLDSKVTVIEKSKLTASAVFSALQDVSGKIFVERLDKVVKAHLDMLTEQDQLANKVKQLAAEQERASEKDTAKAKKDVAEAKAEMEKVQKDMTELAKKQADLWKLTPKSRTDAA